MTVTWLFIIFWPWVCFVSQVNWPEFVARNTSGSLKVEPESSLMYSSAVVFSRVRTSSVHLKSLGYVWIHLTLNFFFSLSCWSMTMWTTRLSRPLTSSLHTTCRTSPGTPSTCPNPWRFSVAPMPPSPMARSAFRSVAEHSENSIQKWSIRWQSLFLFQLSVFDSEGRGEAWPHLLHSVNSSQLEVWLDGIPARATQSRFLLEMHAVGEAYPLSTVDVYQSIDDEYTPSIFKVALCCALCSSSCSDIILFSSWRKSSSSKDLSLNQWMIRTL